MTYSHEVRIRYADCDMQGVVYNAHYLTFIDDAFDCWLRSLDLAVEEVYGWEVMLKKAEITWQTPVKFANKLQIRCEIESWGNTSFTAHFEGKVADAPSFTASVVYVCVDHENYRPIPVPQELHDHLATAQNS